MSRWFRHYAGMMRDEKLVRAAIKSGQSVERVVWIWGAILESAAETNDDGRYDMDCAEAAYFLRADEADVMAVVTALEGLGRLADGRVVKWGDRQFLSDSSSERVRRHRERQKQECNGDDQQEPDGLSRFGNDDVTTTKRCSNAPETETEADTETEKREERASAPPALKIAKERKKGTRISPDWEPSAENIAYARSKGVPEAKIPIEAEKFKNYYLKKSGQGGVMLDWDAAWRNWILQACEFSGYQPPSEPRGPPQVWLLADDPEWEACSERSFQVTGKRLTPMTMQSKPGPGTFVPARWLKRSVAA